MAEDLQLGETQRIIGRVREIFRDGGENFEEGDEKLLVANPPQEPDFPYMIVMMAAMKDLLDIPLELTLIGIIFTTMLSLVLACILFIWCLGKTSGGWWKQKIIRWIWIRCVATILLEFIPFFKMVPATTIFILMAHFHEKKIVRLFNVALEELRKVV